MAEVIALGASVSELDPDAMRGVAFLHDRIRTQFTSAALVTESPEAFTELWAQVQVPVLRLMDAVAVILHEATRASASKAMALGSSMAIHWPAILCTCARVVKVGRPSRSACPYPANRLGRLDAPPRAGR